MKKFFKFGLKFATLILFLTLILSPGIVFAQFVGPCPTGTHNDGTGCVPNACVGTGIGFIFCQIQSLLRTVIPVLVGLGVVYFVWGVVQYVIGSDEEAKKTGRNRIIYGIIGLTVIVGLWGLVNLVVNTFGLGGQGAPDVSSILPSSGSGGSAAACTGNGLGSLICQAQQLLSSIIPLLIALGVVYFIWGVVQYVIAGGEEAKKQGRERIIYGIIGLTIIVSLWGLVNLVVNTFGLSTNNTMPTIQLLGGGGQGGGCNPPGTNSKLQELLSYATCVINNSIIPFIFAIATVMFIWGVVQFFILGADEEAKRTQGKQFIIWGVVALTVMLSVWGLVSILGNTFFGSSGGKFLPQVCPPGDPSCKK